MKEKDCTKQIIGTHQYYLNQIHFILLISIVCLEILNIILLI